METFAHHSFAGRHCCKPCRWQTPSRRHISIPAKYARKEIKDGGLAFVAIDKMLLFLFPDLLPGRKKKKSGKKTTNFFCVFLLIINFFFFFLPFFPPVKKKNNSGDETHICSGRGRYGYSTSQLLANPIVAVTNAAYSSSCSILCHLPARCSSTQAPNCMLSPTTCRSKISTLVPHLL